MTEQATGVAAAPPLRAQGVLDRRGVFSWCLFDWANSAFSTVIGTFVFSVYFARGIYGDETAGSAAWGYAIGLSGLAVAMLSPVLGAIADRAGRRKPWLAAFVVLTVVATALLWYAEPRPAFIAYALALVVIASIAFELAGVFYNAMLLAIAPRPLVGRVSGWGWGLGYIGGLACLALALVGFIQPATPWFGVPTENAANIRATTVLVAAWFAVFSLPLFAFTRDEPATGVGVGAAVRQGIATLIDTVRQVRRHGQIVRFLIASALYRDGLVTLFAVGGLYAAGTFAMSFEQILVFAIGLNVTAGLGAVGFAWLDDGVGSKPTILIALAGLIGFGVPLLLISDATLFIVLALGLGIFVGPAQAASRTLMARLAPADLETEMFGLYAMTGKSIAFLGPMLFALGTDIISQRVGMSTVILFWLAGGLLLLTVREPARAQPDRANSRT
ncbi:MAG: MFS transporter [Alphaproteobacteria bacterium]